MNPSYFLRIVTPASPDPLFTKLADFTGHIPAVEDEVVFHSASEAGMPPLPGKVLFVRWRGDFTALEVTTVVDVTDALAARYFTLRDKWNRARGPIKPKVNPMIDDDE